MTTSEKVSMVQTLLLNDSKATDALVEVLLTDAENAILRRLYPFGVPETVTAVPSLYETLQCKLAVRYFARMGAEGETTHDENGINRHFGTVNDEDLLMEITPYAKLPGVSE